jgi:hypothetical protein
MPREQTRNTLILRAKRALALDADYGTPHLEDIAKRVTVDGGRVESNDPRPGVGPDKIATEDIDRRWAIKQRQLKEIGVPLIDFLKTFLTKSEIDKLNQQDYAERLRQEEDAAAVAAEKERIEEEAAAESAAERLAADMAYIRGETTAPMFWVAAQPATYAQAARAAPVDDWDGPLPPLPRLPDVLPPAKKSKPGKRERKRARGEKVANPGMKARRAAVNRKHDGPRPRVEGVATQGAPPPLVAGVGAARGPTPSVARSHASGAADSQSDSSPRIVPSLPKMTVTATPAGLVVWPAVPAGIAHFGLPTTHAVEEPPLLPTPPSETPRDLCAAPLALPPHPVGSGPTIRTIRMRRHRETTIRADLREFRDVALAAVTAKPIRFIVGKVLAALSVIIVMFHAFVLRLWNFGYEAPLVNLDPKEVLAGTRVVNQLVSSGIDPESAQARQAVFARMNTRLETDPQIIHENLDALVRTAVVRTSQFHWDATRAWARRGTRRAARTLIVAMVIAWIFASTTWLVRAESPETKTRETSETSVLLWAAETVRQSLIHHYSLTAGAIGAFVMAVAPSVNVVDLVCPKTESGLMDMEVFEMPEGYGAYRPDVRHTNTTCLGWGDDSKRGKQCAMKMKPSESACCAPDARGGTLVGWATRLAYVLRKCPCDVVNAIRHRHGAKQPAIQRLITEVFDDFVEPMRGLSMEYVAHPMREFVNWIAKWPLSKQASILRSIAEDDLCPNRVKAMIKREINHKRPSKARLIQFYANLRTQAEFGPHFYAAQKVVCAAYQRTRLNGGIDVTFASGMNSQALADWMESVLKEGAVSFYERDGKNWDSSMQKPHADFKTALYAMLDTELADFARKCSVVNGIALVPNETIKYTMSYTVQSGQNDTTLGNSIVNAAIAYAAFKRLGLRGSILVAGDDLLVAGYEPLPGAAIAAAEAEYGITPEARVFEQYKHVTFISGAWFNDGEQMAFLPLPGRLFARLWWTVNPPSKKKTPNYMRGVARGLLPCMATFPVVGTMLKRFDSEGAALDPAKHRVCNETYYAFGRGMYEFVAEKYGITVGELEDLERYLESLPVEPLLLVHPVIDRLMEVDLADIDDRGNGIW